MHHVCKTIHIVLGFSFIDLSKVNVHFYTFYMRIPKSTAQQPPRVCFPRNHKIRAPTLPYKIDLAIVPDAFIPIAYCEYIGFAHELVLSTTNHGFVVMHLVNLSS
jgi:hypothetical protein